MADQPFQGRKWAKSRGKPCEFVVSTIDWPQIHDLKSTSLRRRCDAHRYSLSPRSEEHTSELQSLMRISYAVFCLKKNIPNTYNIITLHSRYNATHQIIQSLQ